MLFITPHFGRCGAQVPVTYYQRLSLTRHCKTPISEHQWKRQQQNTFLILQQSACTAKQHFLVLPVNPGSIYLLSHAAHYFHHKTAMNKRLLGFYSKSKFSFWKFTASEYLFFGRRNFKKIYIHKICWLKRQSSWSLFTQKNSIF